MSQMRGFVKFYNSKKGFGFITPTVQETHYQLPVNKPGVDHFFHITNVRVDAPGELPKEGMTVSFESIPPKNGKGNPEAINIQILGGAAPGRSKSNSGGVSTQADSDSYPQAVKTCNKCGREVSSNLVKAGRAHYKCSCGNKFSGQAFYGKKIKAGGFFHQFLCDLFGTEDQRYISEPCIQCGGTGRPTGKNDSIVMFQCESCLRKWTKKTERY